MTFKQDQRKQEHDARIRELTAMAQGLYGTLHGLVAGDAHEAMTVISILHLMHWFNAGDREACSTDKMLEHYCENFKVNAEANEQRGTVQ